MKVLVVEDDPNKSHQLSQLIREILPSSLVSEKQSYQSGLKEILFNTPDLILLDMTMPTFDVSPTEKGGRPRAYAGRDILREIQRNKLLSIVLVVTQFESFGEGSEKKTLEELKQDLRKEFPTNYVDTIYYHPAASNWKKELTDHIRVILASH